MTAQQRLVGLTKGTRLGTNGTWAVLLIGFAAIMYVVAKSTGLVR